jgi:hypothetical protein
MWDILVILKIRNDRTVLMTLNLIKSQVLVRRLRRSQISWSCAIGQVLVRGRNEGHAYSRAALSKENIEDKHS